MAATAYFAPLLGSTTVVQEAWLTNGALASGNTENIAWRRAGDLLYGVIELDEADFPGSATCSSLQAASAEAYRRIFRLLDAAECPTCCASGTISRRSIWRPMDWSVIASSILVVKMPS
jgi:hypothetical protein